MRGDSGRHRLQAGGVPARRSPGPRRCDRQTRSPAADELLRRHGRPAAPGSRARCAPGPCSRPAAARWPAPARPATPRAGGWSPPARRATRASRPSARPPHWNSTRVPPLNFSQPVTAMTPMPPVRATCVPPQADRSKSVTSTRRSVPVRPLSLRSGSDGGFLGRDEPHLDRDDPPRRRDWPRSSAAAISAGVTTRCRSMVALAAPRWKLSVRAWHTRSNAADSTCWPVCCCMWSKRRAQSTAPSTRAPTSRRSVEHVHEPAILVVHDVDRRGGRQGCRGRAAVRRRSDRTRWPRASPRSGRRRRRSR